ncbi:hypothetical protein A2U01_0000504 [Trifolium medium]|uniref:RNase H type-1 domain-containing protein n=1 Tax=Trifolium medium TaxID=97028 RepID=A0A392LXU7_9FABA|nr:hypothetical protein [Trifolium medium]
MSSHRATIEPATWRTRFQLQRRFSAFPSWYDVTHRGTMKTSEFTLGPNMKVVDFSLSFPTHGHGTRSDTLSSSYGLQKYNYYCAGACIRDRDGRFVQAFMKKSDGNPTISEAEAKDCLQVVQAFQSKQKNYTEFGAIIDRCRSLVNVYENCRISNVRRQANRVARDYAQASRFIVSPQVLNTCPSCTY